MAAGGRVDDDKTMMTIPLREHAEHGRLLFSAATSGRRRSRSGHPFRRALRRFLFAALRRRGRAGMKPNLGVPVAAGRPEDEEAFRHRRRHRNPSKWVFFMGFLEPFGGGGGGGYANERLLMTSWRNAWRRFLA